MLGAAVLVLYSIDLGRAPIYLHPAEVLFALQAHSVATTAHDVNGRLLPLYFQMAPIGANVWFQPVIEYVMAPFFWLLPFTEWSVRVPTVLVGVLDVVLLAFVARRVLGDDQWALAAAALLALTPAHFIHSRIAMDYLYPVPFVLAWLLLLLKYFDRRDGRLLFIAGSVLGIGVYSYIASAIMMPVYLLLTWLAVFLSGERTRRPYLTAAVGFLWPLAIAVVWVTRHPSILTETLSRYQTGPAVEAYERAGRLQMTSMLEELRRPVRFFDVIGRVSLYWYFFDPAYLFLSGSYANIMNSTRRVGVFLAPLIVFVPVGLGYLATRARPLVASLLLLGFVSAPLAAVLVVPEPYAVDRELVLLPFAIMIATFGIRAMLTARPAWLRYAAIGLVLVLPLHFAFLCFDYWRDYPLRIADWFEGNRRAALETMIEHAPVSDAATVYFQTDRLPYIDAYWRFYLLKNHRQDLLAKTKYITSSDDLAAVGAPHGLLLMRTDDAASAKVETRTAWRQVATFPEPGRPPMFALFER